MGSHIHSRRLSTNMYVAEEIGFEKLDILSQRGIGHIKEAVEIIRKNRGDDIDAHRVQQFKKDPKVKEQLESGETVGCFYVESPAMQNSASFGLAPCFSSHPRMLRYPPSSLPNCLWGDLSPCSRKNRVTSSVFFETSVPTNHLKSIILQLSG